MLLELQQLVRQAEIHAGHSLARQHRFNPIGYIPSHLIDDLTVRLGIIERLHCCADLVAVDPEGDVVRLGLRAVTILGKAGRDLGRLLPDSRRPRLVSERSVRDQELLVLEEIEALLHPIDRSLDLPEEDRLLQLGLCPFARLLLLPLLFSLPLLVLLPVPRVRAGSSFRHITNPRPKTTAV